MTGCARWCKQSTPVVDTEWKSSRIYTMAKFNVPDIKWVERYLVGISTLDRPLKQNEIEAQMSLVNRALRYGIIVSVEQNFIILTCGEKDTLTQYTVYHVGFKQRPAGK